MVELDIVHSTLWGSEYAVCAPDVQVPFLSRARMLHMQNSEYRLSLAEYRQPRLPSSYQLHQLVLRHLSKVVKNLPCLGFKRDLLDQSKDNI
jgi:hypothetical protein